METTTAGVPEIKLAKVGKDKDKDRKKGGAAWLGEGAGKGAFAGATGGQGAGNAVLAFLEKLLGPALAALLPKALVALMMLALGFGAISVGRAVRALGEAKKEGPKKAFASKPAASSDASTLVQGSARAPLDSLGMVAGSLDGKTQAERDAEAAKAAAAAKADAAGKENPADAAPAAAAAGPAGIDPAAIAAAAAGKGAGAGKAEGAKKGFGGMNIGGAGMAGGSGGLSATGLAHGIANNSSLGGGLRNFGHRDAQTSRVSSALSRPGGFGRGLGFRQLANASNLSAAARNSAAPETASTLATNAFQQGTNPGQVVSGAGDGTGANGASGGGSTPGGASSGGGGGQQGPSYGGGNGGAPQPDMCDTIFPSGGYINSSAGGCVCPPGQSESGGKCTSVAGTGNGTPGKQMADLASILLKLAFGLLMVAAILATIAWALCGAVVTSEAGAALLNIARYISFAAAALAGIATVIGIGLWAMGGVEEDAGKYYTISGGVATTCALVAAWGIQPPGVEQVMGNAAITCIEAGGALSSGVGAFH